MVTRLALLCTCLGLCACLDATSERARRDFEEIGNAVRGNVRLRIEPGVELAQEPVTSLVRFRANAPSFTVRATSAAAEVTRFTVEVTNVFEDVVADPPAPLALAAARTIRFELAVPPGGAAQVAFARPGAENASPFRWAWIGDVQGGIENFGRVRERINADPSLELVVFAGDVTQRGMPDEVAEFVEAADRLAAPWYALIGNHETIQGHEENFQRSIGRSNVAFDYRGARFLLFDSASATLDERVRAFVQQRLDAPGPALRVAGSHIPPFDYSGLRDGGFSSRAEAGQLVSRLAKGGVDLLLAGHLHTLAFSRVAGMQAIVSGNGGVEREARLDGSSTHYLAVTALPGEGRFEVEVAETP